MAHWRIIGVSNAIPADNTDPTYVTATGAASFSQAEQAPVLHIQGKSSGKLYLGRKVQTAPGSFRWSVFAQDKPIIPVNGQFWDRFVTGVLPGDEPFCIFNLDSSIIDGDILVSLQGA